MYNKSSACLIVSEFGDITNKQLLSGYMSLKKIIKQNGFIVVRIFSNIPISKRVAEQPLGKGKANTNIWKTPVKPGTIIFEVYSTIKFLDKFALKACSYKFPIKTRIGLN